MSTYQTTTPGRPPLPPKDRSDERVAFVCREDQKAAYAKAAERMGLTLSAWIKTVADKAAKK